MDNKRTYLTSWSPEIKLENRDTVPYTQGVSLYSLLPKDYTLKEVLDRDKQYSQAQINVADSKYVYNFIKRFMSTGRGKEKEKEVKPQTGIPDDIYLDFLKSFGKSKTTPSFGINLQDSKLPSVEEAPEFIGERERPHPAAILVGGGLSALGDALAYGFSKGRVGGKFDATDYIRSLREMKDRIYTDKLNKYKMDIENKDKKFDKEYKLASLANDQAYKRAYLQVALAKAAGEGDSSNNFLQSLAERMASQKALEKAKPGFWGKLFGRTPVEKYQKLFYEGFNRMPTPEQLTKFMEYLSSKGYPVDKDYLESIYESNLEVPLRTFSLSSEKNIDPYGTFEANKKFED